jgi:zinc transport system ATP-binding protein
MTAIRAADVTVGFDGAPVLRDVSLTVEIGEVLALLGANGSGKSTLVRALLGAIPARGQIELLGARLGPDVPWHRIGYVPQRVSATSGIPSTALEVVISGTIHGRRLVPPRRSSERAKEALEAVALGRHAHRSVRELSGGQQQRVLIARALVRDPALLFLDEPVAGVDLPSQRAFADALTRLVAQGTTVVVVLHEPGNLRGLLRRAVVLRHGKIVYDGEPPPPHPEHADPTHVHLHPHDGDRDVGAPEPTRVPDVRWRP